jgi:putative transposase
MTRISLDTPCYFITSVTHHRLPIFRTDKFKDLLCAALNEARISSGILIFAYVIMLDHVHIITDGRRKLSDTLRYLNGISARRLIDHLKENGPEESLRKLQLEAKTGDYKYSLWEHHSDKFLLTSESMFMQKVNYIHNNPIADGMVERAEDYRYSSARYWLRKPLLDDEPIEMDVKHIQWYSK